MSVRLEHDARVAPLVSDLVAIAQTLALDASVFPRPSLPAVLVIPHSSPYVWIARARVDGPVVGYSAISPRWPGLELTHLAVHPTERGAGLGRALLRAALGAADARGRRVVHLHVSTGNRAALALYESEGFREVRRIRGFYPFASFPDGGDAFMLARERNHGS